MSDESLGKNTNLLYGYNANWLAQGTGNNALFSLPGKALETIEVGEPAELGHWGFPSISLNESAQELLDHLLPYGINDPTCPTNTSQIGAGPLLLNHSEQDAALEALSKTLGVDLSAEDTGFALVKIERMDASQTHPCIEFDTVIYPNPARIPSHYGVRREFHSAMASLKRDKPQSLDYAPERLCVAEANKYLALFQQQGTHFISKVTTGDCIFQVFAMPKSRFERVKQIYANQQDMLAGPMSVLFRNYTSDAHRGNFGYVAEYGHVLSFSSSQTLQKAIGQGAWQEPTFAETTSIFAAFQEGSTIDLNSDYHDVTHIDTQLTSLTLMAEHNRRKTWRRIFKGGLIQIFKGSVPPSFANYQQDDLTDRLSQNQLPGFLSYIATPTINSYRPAMDLSELEFVAPEVVESFTLFSNLIEDQGDAPVKIPGNDVLISSHLFSLERRDSVSVIEVTDAAMENLSISCQAFFGGLLVQNTSGSSHFTLMDGLRFDSNQKGPEGRFYTEVTTDVKNPPDPRHLMRLTTSLQFNWAFLHGSFNALTEDENDRLATFLRECLLWMTRIIPAVTQDETLLDLRVRALDLAHVDQNGSLGAFVPVLRERRYQEQTRAILNYVNQIDRTIENYHHQIENRRTQELLINVGQDLNQNIIESGQLLTGYLDASVAQQKTLFGYYSAIIQETQNERSALRETINDLGERLNRQRMIVESAVANYQQGVSDWQTMEAVRFGLKVAADVFSLGATITAPMSSSTAVTNLKQMIQGVQSLLKVFNATTKLYTDINAGITRLQDAQDAFDNVGEVLTANLDWDELSISFDLALSTGPSDPTVNRLKAELVAAFNTLILRGRALIDAQSLEQDNARDIYEARRQQQMIQEQIDRLSQLQIHLDPVSIPDLDLFKIDLIGLTGELTMVRSQMLGILAGSFTLQDQALRYTTLQPATQIHSFDVLGIKAALVQQEMNRTIAETQLRRHGLSTTSPIEIVVEIPSQELKDGRIYQYQLRPDNPAFFKYVNLRVQGVVAKVEGIKSTDTGIYLVELAYMGRPFFDRDINRDDRVFHTPSRQRTYAFQVEDNVPRFTDQGESWSEAVNPVTPFSTWEISLPIGRNNEGMVFEDVTTKVHLSFVLSARINDAPLARMREAQPAARAVSESFRTNATAFAPSQEQLVEQMAGRSVLNNWDVVFNMALPKINAILKSQFEALKENDAEFGGDISANTEVPGASIGTIQTFVLQQFQFQYGYPQLEFLINGDQTGKLNMRITQGTAKRGSRFVGGPDDRSFMEILATQAGLEANSVKEQTIEGEPRLVLEYYEEVTPLEGGSLTAIIRMSQVAGIVEHERNLMSVVLDMAKGTFAARNIEIDMDDIQRIAFSESVTAYFVQNPVQFTINSLDLTGISTLPDLKPSGFLFNTFQSQDGSQMLQMFIQTHNRPLLNHTQTFISTHVPNPIPLGFESSLMIHSRIFFSKVLQQSIQNNWKLVGVDPGNLNAAWKARFDRATMRLIVDLSQLNTSMGWGADGGRSITKFEPYPSNPVLWDLAGMSIDSSANGSLHLSHDKKSQFLFRETREQCGLGNNCRVTGRSQGSTDVTLRIFSPMSVAFTGSGRNREITIQVDPREPEISARTAGGGPCGSDDLQAQINAQLVNVVPAQVFSQLNFSFEQVSVFALRNLLFPTNHYINLEEVYVPGDLLMLGNFSTDS